MEDQSMLRTLMLSITAIIVDSSLAHADAKYLLLANDTNVSAVITVDLPDTAAHFKLGPGASYTTSLRPTKDDRVLIARKSGTGGALFASPCVVFATATFNPANVPYETFGAFLIYDEGTHLYQFIFWTRSGDEFSSFDTSEAGKKRFDTYRDRLKKALENKAKDAEVLP